MPHRKRTAVCAFKEDWSRHRFYQTIRYLFRVNRSDESDRVPIPFYNSRRLSQEELEDCLQIYIQKRQSDILSSLPHRSSRTSSQPASGVQWPDFSRFGLGNQDFWKVEVAFARLCLAQTKADQQRARTAVKKLAQKGPLALRKALGQAVRQIPQAKRRFSSRDVLLKLKRTHSAWEFVRTFLRCESCLTPEDRENPFDVNAAAQELALKYPYLHMSPEQIAEGLRNQRQADKDTARCYGLSQASIRPLFGKHFPRR